MQIKIKNLGPIREFRADLGKGLIGIFGKNNIGKSYATSIIYLIIKNLLHGKNYQNFNLNFFLQGNQDAYQFTKDLELLLNAREKPDEELAITKKMTFLAKHFFQHYFIENFQQSLHATFDDLGSLQNSFSTSFMVTQWSLKSSGLPDDVVDKLRKLEGCEFLDENDFSKAVEECIGMKQMHEVINTLGPFCQSVPRIVITTDVVEIMIKIFESELILEDINILKKIFISKSANEGLLQLKEYSDRFVFYLNDQSVSESSIHLLFIQFFDKFYLGIMRYAGNVYYFPASRSGLYKSLSAFSQIFAELSQKRKGLPQGGQVDIPSIPEPVSDYFLGLSVMKPLKKAGNSPIMEIVESMERQILKGDVKFNEADKKIYYAPHQTGLDLALSMTSSMVSEITPIVSYLKYGIAYFHQANDSKTLFFIEEPEAHLHPESQTLLMEAFVKLIKQNVNIIFTSHSNYIFNKMNNLILSGDLPLDVVEAIVLENGPKGSLSKTSAKDELGIEDENFIDVAESLFNEKMSIIDSMNNKA